MDIINKHFTSLLPYSGGIRRKGRVIDRGQSKSSLPHFGEADSKQDLALRE